MAGVWMVKDTTGECMRIEADSWQQKEGQPLLFFIGGQVVASIQHWIYVREINPAKEK